jgi:hypothetical protein
MTNYSAIAIRGCRSLYGVLGTRKLVGPAPEAGMTIVMEGTSSVSNLETANVCMLDQGRSHGIGGLPYEAMR